MTHCMKIAAAVCAVLLWGACDGAPSRGGLGESCTARSDCGQGLLCVSQVCVSADDGGAQDSAQGGVGAACVARRDCREGLACMQSTCRTATVGMQEGVRYSGRGETCQAENDCAPDLSCVAGNCTEVSVDLTRTDKACYRVECAAKEDCCEFFVPNENCAAYAENCKTDPIFCNTFHSLCECSQDCIDELCVGAAPGCSDNAECTSLQTPFCVDGGCRQCGKDTNCPGQGSKCVAGVCMAACLVDEQCPALHACQDGECVDVGCQTDRECVFIMSDTRSKCRDKKCGSPCEADTDCSNEPMMKAQRFQVCVQGECLFVGCEMDAECRALFGLNNQQDKSHAVCK
jgi:hypothetical protein